MGEGMRSKIWNGKPLNWLPLFFGVFVTLFMMAYITPIHADAATGRDIVSQQHVNIPKGEIAEDVLVIGNNAVVSGTVTDTLVVINGDIRLMPGARAGIVIDLGGHLIQEPGSQANSTFTLSFNLPFFNSLAVGSALVVGVWALRLTTSAALVAFSVVFAMIFRLRLEPAISSIEKSVRRSGLIGLLTSVLFFVLSGVTAITIIGLPVTAILLLLYGIIVFVGITSVSLWLGRLANVGGTKDRPIWLQALMGATFVMAFGNIPLVGPILLAIASLVGVGSVTSLVWQGWQSRKERKKLNGSQ